MKKFLAIALMLALVVVSCDKPKPEPETKDSISLNTTSWSAPYEGEAFTLTVTASGDFQGTPDVAWLTVSGATVTVAENTTYEPRTGKITFKCGEASATVTVTQEAAPKPKEYTELAGPANSFMVTKGGDYKIKATVIGNGDAGLHSSFPISSTTINPADAALLWEEEDDLVTDVILKDGFICFTCANRDGNAVVAATAADGTILWSWHIWCTEGVSEVAIEGTEWVFMDRNLGAIGKDPEDGEAAFGMYYQWGRKDPFSRTIGFEGNQYSYPCTDPGAGEDNTIAYSIAHPNEYISQAVDADFGDWLDTESNNWLWGSNTQDPDVWNNKVTSFKALFDPCPKGYRVASMWAFNTAYESFANVDGGFTINNGTIFIPNSSFIYCAGHGWWDPYATVWTDQSAAWGDVSKDAFRIVPGDAHMNYQRAFGQPVRCMKHAE